MATATAALELTAEDVFRRFGPIPLRRVRFEPYPASEADLLRLRTEEDALCELVDGVLVEKAMGARASWVNIFLAHMLCDWIDRTGSGALLGPDGFLRLAPGLIRAPDLSFIRWSQFPGGVMTDVPVPEMFPDLAVEVLSPSNTRREIDEKLRDYFAAGTQLVWLVDPDAGTVEVCESADRAAARVLRDGDTLDGGAVLPGFALPVRQVLAGSARA